MSYYSTIQRTELPTMAGRLDPYNNICYSNPWNNMNGYISSFCMLINEKSAKIIVSCYNELPKYFLVMILILLTPNGECRLNQD